VNESRVLPLPARLLALGIVALFAMIVSVRIGSVSLSTRELWDALLGRGDPTVATIIRELRLPRTAQALLVGAALATSGTALQALLRNPLAEPYTLGVSSGAAVGAVITVVTGLSARFAWAAPLASFAGAVVALLLVLRIAFSVGRTLDVRVLLLSGVVVGSFLTAVIWLLLTFASDQAVRSAVFWMMGSNSGASWGGVTILGVCFVPAFSVLLASARSLNLLAIGEPTARSLGASVERTKLLAFGAATVLTATGVAVSGTIGFVGLIVPHALRLAWGGDNRALLPSAALAGAAFLTCADTAARTIANANELPIGVVTALVGVPFFLWLLKRPASI
jgi:ABC-type Fe3+-siderophore transport system permease subunit